MPRGLPLGTVTFLFTDIEDSTRLWEEALIDTVDALRSMTPSCGARSSDMAAMCSAPVVTASARRSRLPWTR